MTDFRVQPSLEELAARELREAWTRFVAWREQAAPSDKNAASVFAHLMINQLAALIVQLERLRGITDHSIERACRTNLRRAVRGLHRQIEDEDEQL